MRYLKISKFEMNMAICEDEEKKLFGIEKNELPPLARVGDILGIDDEGNIIIDEEEAKRRKAKALKESKLRRIQRGR